MSDCCEFGPKGLEVKDMARRQSRTLTEVELEFMQVLWRGGEMGTEEIRGVLGRQGRELADGSVRKVLSILLRKGYVTRKPVGKGFLYKAKVKSDRANASMVQDLLERAFGGSAALMVAALLDSRKVRERYLDEIKRLIAEREGGK